MKPYFLIGLLLLMTLGAFAYAEEGTKPRNDLAFVLGSPGFFNLTYTRSITEKMGVRLTGGGHFLYGGHWVGGQAELFSIITHRENFTTDLSIGFGGLEVDNGRDNGSLTYWSTMFNTRYRRLVAQIGLGWMIAHTNNIREGGVLTAQLGVIIVRFK